MRREPTGVRSRSAGGIDRAGRPPDFFVVGAPKAGTTSLYRWLDQHPSVFMCPIKEPCFFAPEVVDHTPRSRQVFEADAASLRHWLDGPMTEPRANGIVLDWNDYLSLFRYAGDAQVAGEASGNYLHSPNAPAAIRERIPGARIVMILRNPVERLFSQFASAVGARQASGPFGRWIDEQERAESGRKPRFGPIWTGFYARHLQRYRSSFPADRLRVYLYDDYREDPVSVLTDLFAFLGVPDHPIDVGTWHNVTRVPRWPALDRRMASVRRLVRAAAPPGVRASLGRWYRGPPRFRMTPAERRRLIAVYENDVRELAVLIDRDLSKWIEPHAV